jgi:hypothetical protein
MTAVEKRPARPYKFLDPYTRDDDAIFFGRDRETRVLVTDVTVNRLVVLFARTGTGKTSLINAGARPRLERGGFETFYIRVSEDPVGSAREELLQHSTLKTLPQGSLAEQLEHVVEKLAKPIVLFFDQFEEFFIYVQRRDRERARQFIADVARLYRNPESGVHFVFSMREEFFVEMDAFRDEIPNIFHNESNLRLRRFDRQEAYEAIVHPARVFDVRLDADLIEQMLRDLAAASDAGGTIEPAQLQIVCDALWERQTSGHLSLNDYRSLGDLASRENIAQQVLYRRLEDAFAKIESRTQLELLQQLLPALRTAQGTKWVREVEGLTQLLTSGTGYSPDDVHALLKVLEDVRFIRSDRRDGLKVVELSHDYLVDRIDELQRRVRLIWPRRLVRALTPGILPARADLDAILAEAENLNLSFDDVQLLFASAVTLSAQPERWYAIAKGAGANPVQLLSAFLDTDKSPVLPQFTVRFVERLLQETPETELLPILDAAVRRADTTLDAQDALVKLIDTGEEIGLPATERVLQIATERIEAGRLAPSVITWIGRTRDDLALPILQRALNRPELTIDAQAALAARARESTAARDALLVWVRDHLSQVAPETIRALGRIDDVSVVDLLRQALHVELLASDAKSALERASTSSNGEIAAAARKVLSSGFEDGTVPAAVRSAPSVEERTARSTGDEWLHEIQLLTRLISAGRCAVVIGAGIHAPSPRDRTTFATYDERRLLTSQLTSQIAEWSGYDLPPVDFRQAAQYATTLIGRAALTERIDQEMRSAAGPSPLLGLLAELPLRTWITTNYDLMIERALNAARKSPRIVRPSTEFEVPGTAQQPLLLKLHGDITDPKRLVLTEDDFIAFTLNAAASETKRSLRGIVQDHALLLLGWNYRSMENRLVLRLLQPHLPDEQQIFAVEPSPDPLIRRWAALESLHVIADDLWSFIPKLHRAVVQGR